MKPLNARRWTWLIVVAGWLAIAGVTRAEETRGAAVVRPDVTWGTWDGWGTSLCWWGKVFGDRDDLADLLFTRKTVAVCGESLPGLGLNIARYNAGACSWNEVDGRRMVVSKTILPYRQMEGFWLDGRSRDPQSASWDWSVDANQRAALLKARDRGANRFELFSNSPMWWMCAHDNPSGAVRGTDDNLAPAHREDFAVYIAEVARHAKEAWGIAFTTIDAFNEPVADWWNADCKQEGCHFDPATQAAVLPLLRAELDRRGLAAIPISASDESLYSMAVATWEHFAPATRALIDQFNVHGYEYREGPRERVRELAQADEKRLWNSEYGDGDATGLTLARCLTLDLRRLRPVAWCYWQPFDGGGWGMVDSEMMQKALQRVNPKYYVAAQYVRHIRPGMTMIDAGDDDSVAAYDPAAKRLVLVAVNDTKESRRAVYDLGRFARQGGGDREVGRWLTQPAGAARYRAEAFRWLAGAGDRLECELPAGSVTTLEIGGLAVR